MKKVSILISLAVMALAVTSCNDKDPKQVTKRILSIDRTTIEIYDGDTSNYDAHVAFNWNADVLSSIDYDGEIEYFTYNANNQLIQDSIVRGDILDANCSYHYDSNNRLVSITMDNSASTTWRVGYLFEYNGDQKSKITYYSTKPSLNDTVYIVADLTYEGDNIIERKETRYKASDTTSTDYANYTMSYDNNRNPLSELNIAGFYPMFEYRQTMFTWDMFSNNNVIRCNDNQSTSFEIERTFTYDEDGYPTNCEQHFVLIEGHVYQETFTFTYDK